MTELGSIEARVVVLAPSMYDAPITAHILSEHHLESVVVRDVAELCQALEEGVGAAIVAEEALAPAAIDRVAALLDRQEPWSDLPILLFMASDRSAPARLRTLETLSPLGNITLLERPVSIVALVSAVRSALRSRRRQYAARAALIAQHRTEQVSREQAVELEAILNCIADGVVVYDRDGRMTRSNPAADGILHLSSPERVDPVHERAGSQYEITSEDGRHLAATELVAYRAAVLGERVSRVTNLVRRLGHEARWLSLSATPLVIAGQHRGAVLSMTDMTERKLADQALRDADRHKDEFLGMLSHELRNPLAPIRNSAYILRRAAPGSDEAVRAQRIIERQTEHLARLVDDLLDVTRIARGKIELRRSRLDLREVLLRAAEDFRLLMDERGIAFELSVPTAELVVDADATRITQVVGNLLHNAAKFTPRGGVITLSLVAADGSAEIRVRDTGAGIDAALLPTVFDAFTQGTRTLARTEGGLGLGLALVKGITALHGGSVRAESSGAGNGSEFIVRIPLAARPDDRVGREVAGGAAAALARRRVLVVDDNHDAADSLADILRLRGHVVEVAYDGPSAIATVRAHTPEVVLCDIGLPGMSGYEVARELRAIARRWLQLVAISGYARPEDVKRALDAGFDAHMAKPCDPEKLAQLLARENVSGARMGS